MKLVRNTTEDGTCKYAAVRLDKMRLMDAEQRARIETALEVLHQMGVLENPKRGDEEEFLLVKLKDRNSRPALFAYAAEASQTDFELSQDVLELAERAGIKSPWCKQPD